MEESKLSTSARVSYNHGGRKLKAKKKSVKGSFVTEKEISKISNAGTPGRPEKKVRAKEPSEEEGGLNEEEKKGGLKPKRIIHRKQTPSSPLQPTIVCNNHGSNHKGNGRRKGRIVMGGKNLNDTKERDPSPVRIAAME